MTIKTKFMLSTIASAILASTTAFAQDTGASDEANGKLEVIQVTSQKRVQSIKDVPISVTTINADTILESNLNDALDLSSSIGNFDVSQSGQDFNIIMRGLGSGPNQGFEQTVGTYVDGVYRGRAQLVRSAFLDLERVEVLRGPQSILFGKNTTAGALNITTAEPTDYLSGYVLANYEFDNGYTIDTAISNSLSDNLQARLALKFVDEDGWYYNELADVDNDQVDALYGRLTLAWQPTDNLDVTFRAQRDDADVKGFAPSQGLLEPNLIGGAFPAIYGDLSKYVADDVVQKANPAFDENEFNNFTADHYTLQADWNVGDYVITSVSASQKYENEIENDGDQSPAPLTYKDDTVEKFEQLSQELRVASYFDGDFNFITGVYWQTSELDYQESYRVYPINLVGIRGFTTDSDTVSAFFQGDYKINDKWEATFGIRYLKEDKEGSRDLILAELNSGIAIEDLDTIAVAAPFQAAGLPPELNSQNVGPVSNAVTGGAITFTEASDLYLFLLDNNLQLQDHTVVGNRSETDLLPSFNIRYKMDNGMLYGSVSKGTKAGGYDARANVARDWEFEDEKVTSYELGAKLTLADGKADLNVALFRMDFKDLQTSVYDGVAGFFVQNGAESISTGIELDGRLWISDELTLSGNIGLLDFEWQEFTGAKCFASSIYTPTNIESSGTSCDLSGETNAFSPKVSGSVNLNYIKEVTDGFELQANLEVQHKSSFFTNSDLNPFTKQDAATKLNLRVSLTDINNDWQVALLAKNLTDEQTISFTTDMPFSPAGFYGAWAEQGRSVALQFGYKY